ncbi:elongation factor Ts [Capsulimonas corticalis]|uniref:Elongation factor Ts n=1 Tax=Capsulimonas corticalis TaxID=2219043 RepID=A0A402D106_9BACT|nr:translation elongation factor Ts [Capsulimonas corticalis]BDI31746.1 elongation factor Ts [Capsulimonas corticalis]
MAEITAAMVKELRDKTDAPMMQAKKALTDANGDMEAAILLLREKNSKLEVKEGRISAEGVVEAFLNETATLGTIIELNSETDFVARNEMFGSLAKTLAAHASEHATVGTVDELLDAIHSGTGAPARTQLQETFAKLRENIIFKRFTVYETTDGTVDAYIHMGGKIGVLIELTGQGPEIQALAREIAMHISFSNPKFLSKDEAPANVVETERELVRTRTMADEKNANKPAEILEKIIEGGLNNFFKASALLEQAYIREPKQTIAQLIKGKTEIKRFVRYEIGEASA